MKKYTEYTVEELKEMVFEVNNWDGTLEDYNFYDMEELDELFYDMEPSELLRMVQGGNFNIYDDYFKGNVYGWLESFSDYYVNDEIKRGAKEIVERYFELVENKEIEDVI